jgi:hypothetical protein
LIKKYKKIIKIILMFIDLRVDQLGYIYGEGEKYMSVMGNKDGDEEQIGGVRREMEEHPPTILCPDDISSLLITNSHVFYFGNFQLSC